MERLVQLPGGTWIDPVRILVVEAKPASVDKGSHAVIYFRGSDQYDRLIFWCKYYDDAVLLRDEIADIVNKSTN